MKLSFVFFFLPIESPAAHNDGQFDLVEKCKNVRNFEEKKKISETLEINQIDIGLWLNC